ncbi:class I SAM-dependent methyltransferase [Microlunatus parietis]|uniref:SAM-dependent methyltransferase n=1 Tax=Microlunatus parietis TaxID=682979 RepID=A0A7Y9I753_9ACTN|nr:class I SAM-dependent methyltransferase [Microlunatus parietis]NYE71538.1 SAM-dependent methyltransferase [Microlunatus parietis]
MSGRYYEAEHLDAYRRLRREGLNHWNDLHPGERSVGYGDFQARAFLDRVLPSAGEGRRVLEYGCGTGAAACHLAARGYRVDAVDLVPDAIAMARQFAAGRDLDVRFAVQDICRWPESDDHFDYVVDCFCLQSIVTDEDRSAVLAGVRDRLRIDGRYLIMTAMYDPDRDYGTDEYDPGTGMVWVPAEPSAPDAVERAGGWWTPHRRHLAPDDLRRELERYGFTVLEQAGHLGGELVCELAAQGDR